MPPVQVRALVDSVNGWALWLEGDESNGSITFDTARLTAQADVAVVRAIAAIEAGFTLVVPSQATADEAGVRRFKKLVELTGEGAEQFRTAVHEFVGRARRIPVKWSGTERGFFGAQSFAAAEIRGHVSVRLDGLLHEDGRFGARLVATADVTAAVTVGANAEVTFDVGVDMAATLDVDVRPHLDISLPFPQCPVTFPRLAFPELDLSTRDLSFGELWPRINLPGNLLGQLGLTVEISPQPVPLHITVSQAGDLTWSTDAADVEVKRGATTIITIDDLMFAHQNQRLAIGYTAITATPAPFTIDDGRQNLGPLAISWRGVKIKPEATVIGGVVQLTAILTFDQLKLFARDDPQAVVAVAGELLINSGGVTPQRLELVEPYPVKILATLVTAGGQLIDELVRLIALIDAPSTSHPDVPSPAPLLNALSRIAAAAARAVSFVGEAVVGELLAGLARLAEGVIRALGDLATARTRPLLIELRIAVEPLQLRQIHVTVLGDRSAPDSLSLRGLDLEVQTDWRPGFLIDLADSPGAYLTITGPGSTTQLATVATDLWLGRGAVTEPLRDADAGHGGRADRPLLRLTIASASASPLAIAVAGVSRGRGVFFQRIVGISRDTVALPTGQQTVIVTGDGFGLRPLAGSDVTFTPAFELQRVLPLLGMRDPGSTNNDFLEKLQAGIGQVVWLESVISQPIENGVSGHDLTLGLRVAGITSFVTLTCTLELRTLTARFGSSSTVIPIHLPALEYPALGLVFVFFDRKPLKPGKDPHVFNLEVGEDTRLILQPEARVEVRFPAVSSDGRGIVFEIDPASDGLFRVSRAGLDLVATVKDDPVILNGLDVPFRFTSGRLAITANRLVDAAIAGQGRLPPELVGEANVTIALKFARAGDGTLAIESATAVLDKSGDPIVCHSTRFVLTLSELGFSFVYDRGYHFYFLLTGSAEFRPNAGEFSDGLLKHLSSVRIVLDRVPLAGDARVLARHISFQVVLAPKKTFNLFDIFEFELRGIGFHPSSDMFDGDAAMNISGQIRFAEIGDIMQPKIDFHGLHIAPPAGGGLGLPRIRAERLGVDIGLSGTARIAGTVSAVDGRMPSLIVKEAVPPELRANGFLGSGLLSIEGWGQMSAAMGFLELSRAGQPDPKKKAFFLYLQRDKISYEIPTPIWPLFLREVGFGFGYRYTLAGIKAAETATSPQQLIRLLDDVAKRQGDLANYGAWAPDLEDEGDSPRVTLALRGALTLTSASKNESYNEGAEKELPNPFLFDVVAALRSDMTFLMSLRGWLALNYADFLAGGADVRERPGYVGYLFISAPRSEFLGRFLSNPGCHIGSHPPLPSLVHQAIRSVQWSSTLYIRPGLFHFELGWPNQLSVTLANDPNFRVRVAGGFVFRIADGALLQGFNVEADAFMRIGGTIGGGAFGVSLEASLAIGFVARLIAYIDTRRFSDTLFYGLIALHARLVFSVHAWLRIELAFCSFTISIGFSFTLQLSCALEIAIGPSGIGAHGHAHVAITVFGCSLGIGVGFTIGGGFLSDARSRVERFLSVGLTATTPEPSAQIARQDADRRVAERAQDATVAAAAITAPVPQSIATATTVNTLERGRAITATHFNLVLRRAEKVNDASLNPNEWFYAMLVPRDLTLADGDAADIPSTFYAEPPLALPTAAVDHTIVFESAPPADALRFLGVDGAVEAPAVDLEIARTINWDGAVGDGLALRPLWAECFLYEGTVQDGKIVYTEFREPAAVFNAPKAIDGSGDHRLERRDALQRAHHAERTRLGHHQRAHDLRATLLAQFAEQFDALALEATRPDGDRIHVLDTELVFLINRSAVAALQSSDDPTALALAIDKRVGTAGVAKGPVSLFNPPQWHFDQTRPRLEDPRHEVSVDGIKLDWTLTPSVSIPGIEHHLHHYEVTRSIEARAARATFNVKPAATLGAASGDEPCRLVIAPDWQVTDNLEDVNAGIRRALLGGGTVEERERAAVEYALEFGDKPTTLTYSVTPIDLAGTRGETRSYVVDINPPTVVVAAARAELLFEFEGVAELAADGQRPSNLIVFAGLADLPKDDVLDDVGKFKKCYSYRLCAAQSAVVPAGTYGVDALVDSVQSPQSEQTNARFAEVIAVFDNDRIAGTTPVTRLQDDDEDDKKNPWNRGLTWYRLAGEPSSGSGSLCSPEAQRSLLTALWGSGTQRVASRFFIETVMTVKSTEDEKLTPRQPVFSARRAVPFESHLYVRKLIDNVLTRAAVAQLRPDTFEWPVQVPIPTHHSHELHVAVGFAQVRMPKPDRTLDDLLARRGVDLPRDPERRLLTRLSWSAFPSHPGAHHHQYIAGYDVHQLDIDELPSTQLHADGTPRPEAWQRDDVRHVARAQLLTRSSATLVPHHTTPLQNWHASYPSDAWRALREAQATTRARPMRRPWLSAAESSLAWPKPVFRRQLLPVPDEQLIVSLFSAGIPDRLTVTATCRVGNQTINVPVRRTTGAAPAMSIDIPVDPAHAVDSVRRSLFLLEGTITGQGSTDDGHAERLGVLSQEIEERGLSAIDEMFVTVAAGRGGEALIVETFPVRFDGGLHPVLEELMHALQVSELPTAGAPQPAAAMYQRRIALPQPPPTEGAKSLTEFLNQSDRGKDPYGWGVLQSLGLARAIRLYDEDEGAFVTPRELVKLVNQRLQPILHRYEEESGHLGTPIVEVLLRPGEDVVPGMWDARPARPDASGEFGIDLDDVGLALVQVSMRPRPLPLFGYVTLTLVWPTRPNNGAPSGTSMAPRVFVTARQPLDVLHVEQNALATVEQNRSVAFVLPAPPLAPREQSVREQRFTLALRVERQRLLSIAGAGLLTAAHEVVLSPQGLSQLLSLDFAGLDAADRPAVVATAVLFPQQVRQTDPFEQFEAASAKAIRRRMIPDVADQELLSSWRRLGAWSRALGNDFVFPVNVAEDTFEGVLQQYVEWSSRFVEHCALPIGSPGPSRIGFALAAPETKMPLKVGPTEDGVVSLSLLHKDRWARVRAYAVRPFGRYEPMVRLARPGMSSPNVGLTVNGFAVAVTPRTERIETPMILGSCRTDPRPTANAPVGRSWELVVARHPEQALTESNRALFAHLAYEGVALSFLREYLHPDWARRFGMVDPSFVYPEIAASPPTVDRLSDSERLSDAAVDAIANRYPTLWRGADVHRFERLPHFYRVIAFATARAGLVTSPIATATQQDFFYQLPRSEVRGRWSVVVDGNDRRVEVVLPLISYRECADQHIDPAWLAPRTVADVPDAEVSYSLLLKSRQGDVEEQELDITRAESGAAAFGVHARGTRLQDPRPEVLTVEPPDQSQPLTFELRVRSAFTAQRLSTPLSTGPEWDAIRSLADQGVFRDWAEARQRIVVTIARPADIPAWRTDAATSASSFEAVGEPGAAIGRRLRALLALSDADLLPQFPSGAVRETFDWVAGTTVPADTGAVTAVADHAAPIEFALVVLPTDGELTALLVALGAVGAPEAGAIRRRVFSMARAQLFGGMQDVHVRAFRGIAEPTTSRITPVLAERNSVL